MPHRTSKHGTFRPRPPLSWGGSSRRRQRATTATEFHKRDALLTRIYDQGRLDLLRAIQTGTLNVTEVYAADRSGSLTPSLVTAPSLGQTFGTL